MINLDQLIKSKINRIIDIRLTDGVQPEDLASNIYLGDYKKISFYKLNDKIIGELTFKEMCGDKKVNTVLVYTYNDNKKLLKIEEKVGNKLLVQWDRELIEAQLINDIVDILKIKYSSSDVKHFIKTLPDDLKIKIESLYNKVA